MSYKTREKSIPHTLAEIKPKVAPMGRIPVVTIARGMPFKFSITGTPD
jgi:hypothetical protein